MHRSHRTLVSALVFGAVSCLPALSVSAQTLSGLPSSSQQGLEKGLEDAPGHQRQARPPHRVKSDATSTYKGGYKPSQVRYAYGLDTMTYDSTGRAIYTPRVPQDGTGQTIALVVAYGSNTIQADFNTFNAQFGLSAQTLTILYPEGKPAVADAGWAMETALDIEWAHAIAPRARLLLVVAKSSGLGDLLGAVDYATQQGATVVSMSWAASEFSSEASYDSHFSHPTTAYVASSGDAGAGVNWPSVSPRVVSIGGTYLPLNTVGAMTYPETGWSGSGGGVSAYMVPQSYQSTVANSINRSVPDVSFDADLRSGVAIYDSTPDGGTAGWFVVGGTSVSAPCWAGLIAMADQGRVSLGKPALSTAVNANGTPSGTDKLHSALYTLASGSSYTPKFRDILSGSNGTYTAVAGYDLVTGLGSPIAYRLVPGLISQ